MISFKSITPEDIPTVVGMMQQFYAIDNYPIDPLKAGNLIRQVVDNPELGKVWNIYKENELAGYVVLTIVMSFEYGGKIGFLDELYIAGPFRGQGIGRESVAFIQQEADKLSLKVLYLEVEPHNEGAQKLYIAAGFAHHARSLMLNRRT
jgi:ribosomal protein S18 acetylase RimI-like enzyme